MNKNWKNVEKNTYGSLHLSKRNIRSKKPEIGYLQKLRKFWEAANVDVILG